MAIQTVHLVQAYIAGRGKALKAEQTLVCASADADLGDYDENPTLIFKAGQLPPPFDEM